jgi:hypothetical protein
MMSQSLANHNGLWDGVYQGNVFSHGIYWQHAMGHTCLWANVIDDGGSHCIQNRGGGIAAKNLFSRHGIGILMLNLGGTVANNVFCELRDILDGQYRGEAIQLGVGSPVAGYGLIENNLILHANVVSGVNAFSVDTGNSASGNNALQQAARPLFLWERNDTALQHGPTQWDIVLPAKHRRNNNISQNIAAGSDLLFKASFSASPDWSMLESDYNVYFSAMSNPFSGISGASSFATWRQVTGNDAHLINQSVTFANGNYKLNNYAQELGYADWSALITAARGRAMGAWLEDFGGSKALGLFAAAYRPTNLAGLGNGPFDYVGAVDYRQPVAVSYTLTGPGTGQVNQAIVYTVQPTAASSETLGLSDSDGSGIFTPTSLTWNGTADPLQFQYVPKTQGAQTIAVTRQGTSLATRSLSVSGSPRRLERRYGALRGSVGCGID